MIAPTEALRQVIDGIELSLSRFPNMWNEDASIAFSGGKDSIALAYGLASMGRRVGLRAIDMGYSPAWRGRIESIARALSLPLEVVAVSKLAEDDSVDLVARRDLAVRRAFLDGPSVSVATVTPCTNCYNCKIISLVYGGSVPTPSILFAHHAQDALSSFLKSALMYIDRWESGRLVFDKEAFRAVGSRIAADLSAGRQSAIDQLAALLSDGKAHTSEPPVERRSLHGKAYVIARPLFFVDEAATAAVAKISGASPESSGCGHSATAATRTPREIVHHELLPSIASTSTGRAALGNLLQLLATSLSADGTAKVDVRAARHQLLGANYKGGPDSLADRL